MTRARLERSENGSVLVAKARELRPDLEEASLDQF